MNKNLIMLIGSIGLALITSSCQNPTEMSAEFMDVGIISKMPPTTFQYGTHRLVDSEGILKVALFSDKVNLDSYIDRIVTVCGKEIEGYPVTGGPKYINVTKIEIMHE